MDSVPDRKTHSILDSKFPVYVEYRPELCASEPEFLEALETIRARDHEGPKANTSSNLDQKSQDPSAPVSPFVQALLQSSQRIWTKHQQNEENVTATANGDQAYISSQDPLVDFFYKYNGTDQADVVLLARAWKADALATLKIIFNCRSIHLGKADRKSAYKAFAWLYRHHPLTFMLNLSWLVRPVISKPSPKKTEQPENPIEEKDKAADEIDDQDDFELVDPPQAASFDFNRAADRKNGMAHGYWKDLVNLLALASENLLTEHADHEKLFEKRPKGSTKEESKARPNDWIWDQKVAKKLREDDQAKRAQNINNNLRHDRRYTMLHICIARLFATQLKHDLALLNSSDDKDKWNISLCAKWAPSPKEFHDKHTLIVSSIAEIMFTHEQVCPESVPKTDRETYLKHARLAYRTKVISPLRKMLDVVERKITTESFSGIKYQKVPSLAMSRYAGLFMKKDEEHFGEYLDEVATGSKSISGAILFPSVLVSKIRGKPSYSRGKQSVCSLQKVAESRVANLQWNTLVQRIRDSGKLEAAIGIADMSGSMQYPVFKDDTCPMDSSIGMSLLISEVQTGPFGGVVISFSEEPFIIKVGGKNDNRSFIEKVKHIAESTWGLSTNFVAVFEKLILPMAIENNVKQEDMVKTVFVFSDMQFNSAEAGYERAHKWSSSYERIKKLYQEAGYDMPTLVFWNLAASTSSVPVGAEEPGTAMVSGYSASMLKIFLDGGDFEQEMEEEEIVMKSDDSDSDVDEKERVVEVQKEMKVKQNSITTMRKAISHEAYGMLMVVD